MGKERSGDCVRLAEADPLLTRDVPLDAAEIVRRRLVASVVEIPADEGATASTREGTRLA